MKAYCFVVLLLIAQAAFLGGCNSQDSKPNDVAQVKEEKKPPEVFVFQAKKQLLYTPLEFAGLLKAREEIRVYTQLAGTVKRVFAQEGRKVYKGQKLLSVTPDGLGLAYKEHHIVAPKTGVLVRFELESGQHINAHQELGLISNYKEFETTIYGTDSDLAYLRTGMKLSVILSPSTPLERRTEGEVIQIALSPDSETLAYKIKVKVLCEKNAPCREGMRLGSLVRVEAKQNERLSYLVPSKYLQKRATQVIIVQDGKAKWVDIKAGEVFGDQTELVSGLDERSLIISSYSRRPTDGESVHIVQNEDEQKPVSTLPDKNNAHL